MEKIPIQELNELFATRTRLSARDAERLVRAMFDVLRVELANGNPVKVKGLGTFKIVDVDSRESVNVNTGERVLIEGHGKLTFVPDATMKELVNRPFSQFETVVLNEGVDFSDDDSLATDAIDNDIEEGDTDSSAPLVEDEQPEEVAAPVAEPEPEQPEEVAVPVAEPEPESEQPEEVAVPVAEPEPEEPEKVAAPVAEPEPEPEQPEEVAAPVAVADESNNQRLSPWLWAVLWVVVIGVSAFIGYLYGANEDMINKQVASIFSKPATPAEVVEPTTALQKQTKKEPTTQQPTADEAKADTTVQQKAKPETEATPTNAAQQTVDYGARDPRVRTGAYTIVGTASEVTVKQGETAKSISDRYLGPGMECYIEVYNGISASSELTPGSKIKIPELQLKRRAKK